MTNRQPDYKSVTVSSDNQDFNVRYFETGSGAPLLFLHGWGTGIYSWFPLLDSLRESGRLVAIDFPGFGESTRPENAWDTEKYGEFVFAFADKIGLESFYVAGHSFGGRVAIRMANRNPQRINGMVLIASAGLRGKQPFFRRMRVKTVRAVARCAEILLPGSLGKNVKEKLYGKIASRDYLAAGEMRRIMVKVVNEDLTEPLQNIHVPSLLIWGGDDMETPTWIGNRMNELLSKSKYIVIPGMDHYSILDRARHQTSHQIRQFIRENASE